MNVRWRPLRPASWPATSPGLAACWPRPTPGHSTSSSARGRPAARPARVRLPPRHRRDPAPAGRRPPARAAGRLGRAGDVRGCVLRSAVRRKAQRQRRGPRSRRPPGLRRAHRMRSRLPRICCWTHWSLSPTTTTRRFRAAGRPCNGSPASRPQPRNDCAGCGRLRRRPRDLGRRTRALAVALQRRDRPRDWDAERARARPQRARADPGVLRDLAGAAGTVAETRSVQETTGIRSAPYGALILSAWRGRRPETTRPDRDHGARGRGPRRGHRTRHQRVRARRPLQRAGPV